MYKVLFTIKKELEFGYEMAVVYENGHVDFESMKDGSVSKSSKKISIVSELKKQFEEAEGYMLKIYSGKKPNHYPIYEICYHDNLFYDFDFYVELNVMIKYDQMKRFCVFSDYEKLKKRIIEENNQHNYNKVRRSHVDIVDGYVKNREVVDISDVSVNLDDFKKCERKNICFELKEVSDFTLGQSRFFSNIIDISSDVSDKIDAFIDCLQFIGQINLADFKQYDIYNLFPDKGILYFFAASSVLNVSSYFRSLGENYGVVVYGNGENLTRKIIQLTEHDKEMILFNYSVVNIKNDFEKGENWFDDMGNYNEFYHEELNKIYGFYQAYQMDEEEIFKISDKYVVLLQLGSCFYGEGVMTYLIREDDLKHKRFDKVIYTYSQT